MKLGLILGDQLSPDLATLRALDKERDLLLMAEVPAEATYVRHHQQKIAFIFSAMRHFAVALEQAGWRVRYLRYGEHNFSSLLDALLAHCDDAEEIVVAHCGEHRLQQQINDVWPQQLPCPVRCLEDDRFICSRDEFARWARGKKQLRMEFFYREMRRKTGLLMEGNEPVGGQWNFDSDNRSAWRGGELPQAPVFERDDIDREVLALVAEHFSTHIGNLDNFFWGTTAAHAQRALDHFIAVRLPHFGDYQDAMASGEDTLFHSLLSPYLNVGLLDPRRVCEVAEQAYFRGDAPLNAVEGFIRQIIGWREYVRGIYWLMMPDYAQENRLGNSRALPPFYWSGKTRMHCLSECLRNTFDHAYAHHIQRLMVTGNLALLLGVLPEEICEWYLAVYADAFDWVELPNTLGMVMHADGGFLGSKPYAASGAYINRMSDYCRHCHYNVKTHGEHDSCPFNSLYWHFIARHRAQFESNPRMRMAYRNLDRMDRVKLDGLMRRAEEILVTPDSY